MTEPPSLDGALRRLHSAVSALEEALASRLTAGDDPALEAATDRADRLEAANRDAAHRIDHAMDTIRSVLGDDARPDAG